MAVLTVNDAISKFLVEDMPLGQYAALRGFASALAVALVMPWLGGPKALRIRNGHVMFWLAALMVLGLFLFPYSLRYIPLADGIMLVSLSPIFVAMLSPWMLGEHVGWRRWGAVGLGVLGAALVLEPGGAPLGWILAAPIVLDLALFILPFHGSRATYRFGRPNFPSDDPRMTIDGFRQAIGDLRALEPKQAQLRRRLAALFLSVGPRIRLTEAKKKKTLSTGVTHARSDFPGRRPCGGRGPCAGDQSDACRSSAG